MQWIHIIKLIWHHSTFTGNVKCIVFIYTEELGLNYMTSIAIFVPVYETMFIVLMSWTELIRNGHLLLAARVRGIRVSTAMSNLAVFIC
jgi:hypothetical protein